MRYTVIGLWLFCAGCNISCFGDSNTASSYPGPMTAKWVQMLNMILPVYWNSIEHGVPSKRLVDVASIDGLAELDAHIIADNAGIAILAYGSVDAFWIAWKQESEAQAVSSLEVILTHLETTFPLLHVYVATVPYTFRNPFWAPKAVVDTLNADIAAHVLPDRLIDFTSITTSEDSWDGLHFCGDPWIAPCTNAHGQQARADAALAVLFP